MEEGADKSFNWKIVPGLCQRLQHQRPPANESSLATAVTGRQGQGTIMYGQERDHPYAVRWPHMTRNIQHSSCMPDA